MSDPTREQLQHAYELVKAGRRTEALHILQQIILADDGNVNAWWLMANVTDTPADRRVALDHVLRLKPDHAKARRMLKHLVEQYPELAQKPSILPTGPETARPQRARPTAPPARARPKDNRRQRLLIGAIAVILVVIVVVVVVLALTP